MSDQQSNQGHNQSLNLPRNYFYHKMQNGIELVGQYMPSLGSITFGFQLDAAVVHEPEEKSGLAHLFEYMLFQGTKQKDVRALNEAFESLGANKGANTGLETTQLWAQIVHTKFDATLALFQEILLTPTFPGSELEQIRNIALQEIRRRDDEPMSRVFELVRSAYYQGTPLARPTLGTTESVRGLERRDLREFWMSRYQPDNVLFSIAGKFDWEHVVAQMETLFGTWTGEAAPSQAQQVAPRSTISLEHQDGKQEHIVMMSPFPSFTDPDFYAGQLISEILGGGMASRLFVEVREKRALVYGVSAGMSSNKHGGVMRIYAGTTPEQAHECLEVIVNELHKLVKDGITADELERAKVQLKSETVMRSEGSGARMGALARSWWYDRRLRTVQEVKEAIDNVTADQIMDVLQRYPLLEPLTVAAIGPLEREILVGDVLKLD